MHEHRSPNVDDGLLQVDIVDSQTSEFADSHGGDRAVLFETLRATEDAIYVLAAVTAIFSLVEGRDLVARKCSRFTQRSCRRHMKAKMCLIPAVAHLGMARQVLLIRGSRGPVLT
jgi:hypothetical protein